MNSKQFIPAAVATESPAKLQIPIPSLHIALTAIGHACEIGDAIKKATFYGKKLDNEEMAAACYQVSNMFRVLEVVFATENLLNHNPLHAVPGVEIPEGVQNLKEEDFNVRLLHSVMGKIGEAGEVLNLVMNAAHSDDKALDIDKIKEELADGHWYDAIAYDVLNVTPEELYDLVIAKLKARYGDKFDANKAVNRDDAAEKAAMAAVAGEAVEPA